MLRAFFLLVCALFAASSTNAAPTISDYARRAEYSGASISPDGTKLSISHRVDGDELLCILDIENVTEHCVANMGYLRNVSTYFFSEDYVLVFAPEWSGWVDGDYQYQSTTTFSVSLEDGEMTPMPDRAHRMGSQTGRGEIVAYNTESNIAYMPLFDNSNPQHLDVFEISLDDGDGRPVIDGSRYTVDWFVSPAGIAYARENFDFDRDRYYIEVPDGDNWREIYTEDTNRIPFALLGTSDDGESLVFRRNTNPDEHLGVWKMSLSDGSISGPFHVDDGRNVEGVHRDRNQVFTGVIFSGVLPEHEMLDPELNEAVSRVVEMFPYASVYFRGMSDDGRRLLFRIEGDIYSGNYFVFDVDRQSFVFSLASRPQITRENMSLVDFIEYPSVDGLRIPAILTFPPGYDLTNAENLPTIVFPHGGPESYDSIGYDWMAQAMAQRGYLVFQPNFRGSEGFGWSFARAGRGEWGRAMQDDITTGVGILASQGWSNPERTCIAGWSYGGYAALIGGAFTPDLYQCVVAIAAPADLHYFLDNVRKRFGDDHPAYMYRVEQFGQNGTRSADLAPISPYHHVEAFTVPVLLMHGQDDVVVSARQSHRMEDALSDAGRDVEYIRFVRRGHSILDDDDREEILTELLDFVDQHIGGE